MTHVSGFGLGLRTEHYRDFSEQRPAVDWLEVISENYMVPGGKPLHYLDTIRRDYPMVMHGVSLSIGSSDALDLDYLRDLKTLAQRIQPAWISDHLCWTGVDHPNLHDLLPLPYTEAALAHLVERVQKVQDFLGRRLLLENVSSYVAFAADEMSEWEFVVELLQRADCELLLDVNNVYVSAVNHGFDAAAYIDRFPMQLVGEIHLAGFAEDQDANAGRLLIDAHGAPVADAVWSLYRRTLARSGPVPTLIEWDNDVPDFATVAAEVSLARAALTEQAGRGNRRRAA
jgi:uncharacterized protein (UPF0276 family)